MLPEGRNRHGDVECYATSRYFTVTGHHVPGTPGAVEERSDALAAVHTEYVATETAEEATESQPSTVSLDDREVVRRAIRAANGERFERLWKGSTAGYSSHSEADMALCCHLAFWTGGDPVRMDRLFRDSGLMREKWDEVHFADGSTYGEKTVSRAVDRVPGHYTPRETQSGSTDRESEGSSEESGERGREGRDDSWMDREGERLRATVERLDKRVKVLESENERLRGRLERIRTSTGHQVDLVHRTGSVSLWIRLKRLVR